MLTKPLLIRLFDVNDAIKRLKRCYPQSLQSNGWLGSLNQLIFFFFQGKISVPCYFIEIKGNNKYIFGLCWAQSLSISISNILVAEVTAKFKGRASTQWSSDIKFKLHGDKLEDSIQSLLFINIESSYKCYVSWSKEAINQAELKKLLIQSTSKGCQNITQARKESAEG